jgi:hypothetical protein
MTLRWTLAIGGLLAILLAALRAPRQQRRQLELKRDLREALLNRRSR